MIAAAVATVAQPTSARLHHSPNRDRGRSSRMMMPDDVVVVVEPGARG
jgi:hypothetical protein